MHHVILIVMRLLHSHEIFSQGQGMAELLLLRDKIAEFQQVAQNSATEHAASNEKTTDLVEEQVVQPSETKQLKKRNRDTTNSTSINSIIPTRETKSSQWSQDISQLGS